ncbi:methylphosphotriester-DNA--protein-cysteine methyltransferase family protein [Metabacillus sp. KIGAM252]|uniref:Methylphosphotriester-DNA--protein-cysteine methyltransferase family protein n=1 Tax=Metabacillus flavus TaxID=2823519 RepID=A0ABS5LBS9_9BACI|nr:Ada metal-binding domain-containing protein [Metabacillus flavus]MBS2968185.1 methylphosphotriester-DNA--protein-cysteine methyltransferase family protein [Metabacillus flavus]
MRNYEWEAIVSCNTAFDGQFFYGVKTTNIFCRPSCRSRTPLRQNVQVNGSAEFFIHQGYRPCKRCQPDAEVLPDPKQHLIRNAKRLIEERYQEELTLQTLADSLYISPYYFHKTFKELAGKSPAQYVAEIRIAAAQALMNEGTYSIAEISSLTGFKKPSHFSRVFKRLTGESPSNFRQKVLK